jgi:hypothetical protein
MVTGCSRNSSDPTSAFTSSNIYRGISAINCTLSPSTPACLILFEFCSLSPCIKFPKLHSLSNFSQHIFPLPSPHPGLRKQSEVFQSNPPCNNFCLFLEMLTEIFSGVTVFNRLTPKLNTEALLSVDYESYIFYFCVPVILFPLFLHQTSSPRPCLQINSFSSCTAFPTIKSESTTK